MAKADALARIEELQADAAVKTQALGVVSIPVSQQMEVLQELHDLVDGITEAQ